MNILYTIINPSGISLIEINLFTNFDIIMGIGDWGLGIGDWGLGIGPNPQSPIPNPQSPLIIINNYNNNNENK